MDGEIQRKIPPTLYCQSLLHSFIHQSLTLSLPEQHKGSGEWEWWSAHSSFTLSPCSHSLWQWGLSAGLQLPSGNIHLPQSGVLPWLQWGIWFSISSVGLGEQSASLQPLHGLQEHLSSGTWNPSLPLSSLTLCLWDDFSRFSFSPHSILSLPWGIFPLFIVSWRHHQQPCWNCWQCPWGSPGLSSQRPALPFPLYCQLLDTNAQYKTWHLLPKKCKIALN